MSAQNIIEFGFNVEELNQQKQEVLTLMVDLFGKLEKYDGTVINPIKLGGLADLKKGISDSTAAMGEFQQTAEKFNETITKQFNSKQKEKKATEDLTLAEKEHEKTLQTIIQTKAKISEADTNAANDSAIEIQRLAKIRAEVNANAKAYLSEIGSLNEAKANITVLTNERNKLNLSTIEGRERLVQLNSEIDLNNEFIRENSAALEKQKINIGNYTGATSVLGTALNNIDQKLAQMAAQGNTASEAFQKLTLEQKLLDQLLQRSQKGFGSITQEMRQTRNTLDALTVAGLGNTEAFHALNIEYEKARQKVVELRTEQKIMTSESPALAALVATARGIGGAYALGAGASALFAEGNEKVEKELNKLVAIMTLLQGLEEAVRALKERGAIATALQATATKALVLARNIEVAIMGTSTTVLKGETIAKELNTEATELNTGAVEANAEGVAINTEAMVGTTVATEGAEVATISFRTALISTGIGAILIGVVYAITKLVSAIGEWINADEKAIEKEKALAEASKEAFALNQQLNEAYEQGAKTRLDQLEKVDAQTKASGQNQFTQFAAQRAIEEQKKQIAADELKRLGVTDAKIREAYALRKFNTEQLIELQNTLIEVTEKGDKSEIERATKEIAANKAGAERTELKITTILGLQKDFNDASAKLDENSIAQAKAAGDLLAKVSEDAAERRYKIQSDKNNRVLSDERSSEGERIAAIKSNYSAEVSLEQTKEAELKRQFDAGYITEKEYNNSVANLQTDLNLKLLKAKEDQEKIIDQFSERRLVAFNTKSKNLLESDAAAEAAISKDLQKDLNVRLDALKKNIADRKREITLDYDLQVKLAKEHGKTQEEIDAIESGRAKALIDLTANTQKDIYDIVISYGEKRLKAIDDLNKAEHRGNDVQENNNSQRSALDQEFLNRNISYGKYIKEKKKLDRDYAVNKAKADVEDDEASLKRIKDYELLELASKKRIATAELVLARSSGNEERIKNAESAFNAIQVLQTKAADADVAATKKANEDKGKLNEEQVRKNVEAAQFLHDKEKELASSALNLAQKLVDAQYENKINHIEETMQKEDEQSANQIAAIQRSTLSQRDQAAEIIIISESQKARDRQLKNEEKQEKRKQAIFDRDVAAAKAGWSTAEAVIGAIAEYGGTPYAFAISAVIAALGAVEIATIFATSIPAYASGVDDHPGGPALAGELYKPELIREPGKQPYIVDKPTILDLPIHSAVIPLDDMVYNIGSTGMARGMSSINDNGGAGAWEIAKWQAGQFRKALAGNKKQIINSIHIHNDYNGLNVDYINKKILGKG